jgi:hypothetical protein
MTLALAAVGVDPGYAAGGGVGDGPLFIAAFALVGLILLYAAVRMVRKPRNHNRHTPRYIARHNHKN